MKNPSLKVHLKEIETDAYLDARDEAAKETGLKIDVFPKKIPFKFEDVLKEDWLPD